MDQKHRSNSSHSDDPLCRGVGSHFLCPTAFSLFSTNFGYKLHDVTDEAAAYKLAEAEFPGYFGIFFKSHRPTKNKLEAEINRDIDDLVDIKCSIVKVIKAVDDIDCQLLLEGRYLCFKS